MGRFDEAEGTVNLLAAAAKNAPAQQGEILQLVVNQELSKPVDERNWERIDELSKIVESGGQRTALQNRLLQAHLALAQGKTDEALGILGSLRKEHPKDISVWLLLCKLMSSDEKYRDRLPQLLNLADKELGPTAAIAMERIKVISRRGGEEAVEQLKKIEAGAVKFEPAQQLAVRAQLGTAYLAAGDYEDGKRCLLEVMASESSNVRIRQALLELALERQDDATVEKIMGELEKSPMFGPESTLYRYAQAASQVQKLVASRKGKTTPLTEEEHRTLADSRKLVDEAIAIRAEWAPLWRLRSDISQMEGDVNGAISDLQRSLSYSQVGQETSARKLVTLLYATQRFAEANEAMKFMGNYELPETMRRIKEAVIVKGGDPKEAIALVRKDIEKEPDNPSNYLWLGEVLEATGDAAGAEQAYRQATQKGPKLGRAWEFLVRRLMANDKREQAAQATEEAVKQLSEEPLSIARLYQRTGNLPQAEKYYLEALAKKPKDLLVMRHLAEFYLLSRDLAKSQQQLDQIIEVASNSQEPMARANLSWARTQKAQTMAPDRDYASTMEAVKLIEQNAQGGELSRPDMLAIISLLSSRMEEPDSRQKAIKLLEKMRSQSPLEVQQAVALAQLYNRQGDWQSGRAIMTDAATRFENSPEVATIFAEMLLEHEQFDEARQFVDRAESLLQNTLAPPTSPAARGVRILRARLLTHDGNQAEAAKVLEGWLPRPLPQNQLPLLLDVAGQMEGLELYADAERLLKEYQNQSPSNGKVTLAGFLGRRGDIEQSFALLNEARAEVPLVEVMAVGLLNLRNFPDKVTDSQRQQLESWGKAAVSESNDPQKIQFALAEMYDLLGRYDEVEKIYREMLADPKLSRGTRAVLQNNLAFVLAGANPTPARGAESLKLIEEAIKVLGPSSDLIDTRALAYMAQGKYDQAAADIRLAVGDRPTTSKYYHLAQVEKQLGNLDAAKDAIAKAQELHPEHNPFTPFERKGYEQLKSEMN
jgi:tetratricopeptide (TPR) repeat protein